MGRFVLRCVTGGEVCISSSSFCETHQSLVRCDYEVQQLMPRELPGIWRFFDWLPVEGTLKIGAAPISYISEGLARELGLSKLFISFSGYWPEKGARFDTCSFKDLEAPPTIRRLLDHHDSKPLVVASAGNTARAFVCCCSATGYPLIALVPSYALDRLWIPSDQDGSIFLVAVDGDYSDAIALGDRLSSCGLFLSEGGAKNVARRDGMGTVMLDAALTIGKIPQHYFQAVGSGTGGISAWEASLRLIRDGRFGSSLPRLHLAQNSPCAPLYSLAHGVSVGKDCPEGMFDEVLYNRKPPFSVGGGVSAALQQSGGEIYDISNEEASRAKSLFEELEGIDIMRAPAVAVAALMRAVESGSVSRHDITLLNITGGGERELCRDKGIKTLRKDMIVSGTTDTDEIIREVRTKVGD